MRASSEAAKDPGMKQLRPLFILILTTLSAVPSFAGQLHSFRVTGAGKSLFLWRAEAPSAPADIRVLKDKATGTLHEERATSAEVLRDQRGRVIGARAVLASGTLEIRFSAAGICAVASPLPTFPGGPRFSCGYELLTTKPGFSGSN